MLKHRPILTCTVCLLMALLTSAAFSVPASAVSLDQFQPSYVLQTGPNRYVVAIPTAKLEAYSAPETLGRQHKENWCWAASIQMALNLSGVDVTQEMVVERVYGADVDKPAGKEGILTALSGRAQLFDGRFVQISSWAGMPDNQEYIHDLLLGWPVLVGLKNNQGVGHAYLMTGAIYSFDAYGQPVFQSVILRDPWPFNQSRIVMPWNEYESRVNQVIRFRVDLA